MAGLNKPQSGHHGKKVSGNFLWVINSIQDRAHNYISNSQDLIENETQRMMNNILWLFKEFRGEKIHEAIAYYVWELANWIVSSKELHGINRDNDILRIWAVKYSDLSRIYSMFKYFPNDKKIKEMFLNDLYEEYKRNKNDNIIFVISGIFRKHQIIPKKWDDKIWRF